MDLLYIGELLAIAAVALRRSEFALLSLYFLINILGLSASVYGAEKTGVLFPELLVEAHDIGAAHLFNAYAFTFVATAALVYQLLTNYGVTVAKVRVRPLGRDGIFLAVFIGILAYVATIFAIHGVAITRGEPVSSFMQKLSSLDRAALLACLAGAPILAGIVDRSGSWTVQRTVAMTLMVCCILAWICAGEKFGYLLFMLVFSVVATVRAPTFRIVALIGVMGLAIAAGTTAYVYSFAGETDAGEVLRFLMQGQLWWFSVDAAVWRNNPAEVVCLLSRCSDLSTIHRFMDVAMPPALFREYLIGGGALTGGFFPALLQAGGMVGGLVLAAVYGAVFALMLLCAREALRIKDPFIGILMFICFVVPGIEIFVVGNPERLLEWPFTFAVSGVVLVTAIAVRYLRLRQVVKERRIGRTPIGLGEAP